MGRTLIYIGIALVVLGAAWLLAERVGIKLGRLPGDIAIERKNGSFYFPIVTCLLLSAVLSLVMWLFRR